jgi:hypothetical protein
MRCRAAFADSLTRFGCWILPALVALRFLAMSSLQSCSKHLDSHGIIPHLPLHEVRTMGRRNRLPHVVAERRSVKRPRDQYPDHPRAGCGPLQRLVGRPAPRVGHTGLLRDGDWTAVPPGCHALVRPPWQALGGGSTPSRRGQARRGAIGGTPAPCFARRQVTRVPRRSTSDRPRPCSPSCHLLPPRFGWRGDARAGEAGCAHQRLPTDRTTLPRLLTPGLARARPVK